MCDKVRYSMIFTMDTDISRQIKNSKTLNTTQVAILIQIGVEKLNLALEEHVSEHYEDLINQATGMDILEEVHLHFTF